MLACTTDGGMFPPYVMFKRKTLPKDKFPAGVIVHVQQKGWIDEGLVQDWVHMVWSSGQMAVSPDNGACWSWMRSVVTRPTTQKRCYIGPTPISSL